MNSPNAGNKKARRRTLFAFHHDLCQRAAQSDNSDKKMHAPRATKKSLILCGK